MAYDPDFRAEVAELLAPLEGVHDRAMFGGVGIFRDERMFGLIAGDTLYIKTDEAMRTELAAMGSGAFGPLASYWAVPAEVLEDDERLLHWGRRAVAAALAAPPRTRRRRAAR